jgi:hypothetical protein
MRAAGDLNSMGWNSLVAGEEYDSSRPHTFVTDDLFRGKDVGIAFQFYLVRAISGKEAERHLIFNVCCSAWVWCEIEA